MKAIIFGDSHVRILAAANEKYLIGNTDLSFFPSHGKNWRSWSVTREQGGIRLVNNIVAGTDDVFDHLFAPGEQAYFSGGLHMSAVVRHRAWHEGFCPWTLHARFPDRQPVSRAVIDTRVLRHAEGRFRMLARLQDGGVAVTVIEAPRPLARSARQSGIPREIIAEVDAISRDCVRETLASMNINIITVPPETVVDGLTSEEFSASDPDDPHHGNLAYGRLMLQRIVDDLVGANAPAMKQSVSADLTCAR